MTLASSRYYEGYATLLTCGGQQVVLMAGTSAALAAVAKKLGKRIQPRLCKRATIITTHQLKEQ